MSLLSSRSRAPFALAASAIALGACNAIFHIEGGVLDPTASTTSSTSTGAGGAGGSGPTTGSTGGGPACAPDAGPATGKPVSFRASFADGGDLGTAAAFDAAGNLVVAGFFDGPLLNLGGGNLPHAAIAADADSVFVVKYDPGGKYLWGKVFGGTKDARPNGLAIDPGSGDIVITGAMLGTLQFGATPALTAISDPGGDYPDAFVVRLDAKGEVKWAKNFGNDYIQRGHRIAVDAKGNAYIGGFSFGKVDFGTGVVGMDTWYTFFLKLDAQGKVVWVQPFDGWDSDLTPDYQEYFEVAVAVAPDGDVIAGGNFLYQDFFGNDVVQSYGGADAFVLRMKPETGEVRWHQTFHQHGDTDAGLDDDQWVTALATDPCTGDVLAAGGFRGGIDFGAAGAGQVKLGDPHDADVFLVRLAAADGAPIWSRTFGDAGLQEATSLKVDPDGNVVLAGFTLDDAGYAGIDFGPGIGTLGPAVKETGPDYYPDALLVKYDGQGKGLWGKRLGDESYQSAYEVTIDAAGTLALTGVFRGTIGLGGGVPPQTAAEYDVFIALFKP